MKNLLYIGNNLVNQKTNTSSIQRLGSLLEAEGYHLSYASHFRNKLIRLFHMCWICIFKSRWADAVLIDTYSTHNFWFAFICSQLCRFFGIPYIPILHGGNLPSRLNSNPRACHLIFNFSLKNVSPSLYLKEAFEAKGYKDVIYIPNSIKINDYPRTPKTFDSIKLLWVRSLSDIYNPRMALDVQKKLQHRGLDVELCMVGPNVGDNLLSLKEIAKDLRLETTFTGKLSKEEWLNLSQDYNIFINTSNFDNMPVSVLEAMALGFPVVSTNVGGMPYVIEDQKEGILVERNDAEAMANAIIKVFEDKKLREELAKNAFKKALTFDWDEVKVQWHNILGFN